MTRQAIAVVQCNEVHESNRALVFCTLQSALPVAKQCKGIGELLIVKSHVADGKVFPQAFEIRSETRFVAQRRQEAVVFARVVKHHVLAVADGAQTVENFAFGTTFAVNALV